MSRLIPLMSAGRAPVVLVGNSAAYWYMGTLGYSQLPLEGKPLGAQKALPSAGPETARNAVVRRQTSSNKTPQLHRHTANNTQIADQRRRCVSVYLQFNLLWPFPFAERTSNFSLCWGFLYEVENTWHAFAFWGCSRTIRQARTYKQIRIDEG